MIRLSVNVNKVALIRNSRGGNLPDLVRFAIDCESYGAQGITVHPRPDERHVRFSDLPELKRVVTTEFNIEGYPTEHFIEEVLNVKPHQVTLVPDAPTALTSDSGWDTIKNGFFLSEVVKRFHEEGIRVSLFLNADLKMLEAAKDTGTDRVELYTGKYAHDFLESPESAVADHVLIGQRALELGLGLNAGHDLNLDNLRYYAEKVPGLAEVSIGHALITDALYFGIENTIIAYLERLKG